MLPSVALAATNLPYLRASDGDTSDDSCDYVSLLTSVIWINMALHFNY